MPNFDGKVAFVTGGARGQGRSHAVNLAKHGADVALFDICDQIDSVLYPMSTEEDLAVTAQMIEKEDRRALPIKGDVRDLQAVTDAVARTVEELGRLDLVVANAGILPTILPRAAQMDSWHDCIDVMLTGVFHTVYASSKALLAGGNGGSIVITGSTSSFRGLSYNVEGANPGQVGYCAAKHGVLGIMREFALGLGDDNIRVNVVAPMGVRTPMLMNDAWAGKNVNAPAGWMATTLKVDLIEPQDVSDAVLWLLSDEARYVTGTALRVDAGKQLK